MTTPETMPPTGPQTTPLHIPATDLPRGLLRTGPEEALETLLAGNRRFAAGCPRYGHDVTSPAGRRADQRPHALVLGCIDSRVPPEAVFDQDLGAIAVARTAGHVLDTAVLGSLEYAVSSLAVPLVLVLGHRYCGAVRAAIREYTEPRGADSALGKLVGAIVPAAAEADPTPVDPSSDGPSEDAVTDQHIRRTVGRLVRRRQAAGGSWAVVGAYYDVDTGRVEVLVPVS